MWVWAGRHTPHFAVDWGGERDLCSLPVDTFRVLCPPQSTVIKSSQPRPGLDRQICWSIIQVPEEESYLQTYTKIRITIKRKWLWQILPDFNYHSYLHWFYEGPLTTDKIKPWDSESSVCSLFTSEINVTPRFLVSHNVSVFTTSEFLQGFWEVHHFRIQISRLISARGQVQMWAVERESRVIQVLLDWVFYLVYSVVVASMGGWDLLGVKQIL